MTIQSVISKVIKILKSNPNIENYPLEARLIICYVMNLTHNEYICNKNQKVSFFKYLKILSISNKRADGFSLESILKRKAFYDMSFYVNKNVLIPRPETELLVDIIFERYEVTHNFNILDVGAGSGNISIILQKNFRKSFVDSLEISRKSVRVIKKNMRLHKIPKRRMTVINKDFFKFIPQKKYDIIISNPPYIESLEAKKLIDSKVLSDPLLALDGGKDGLDYYRRLRFFADNFLNKSGIIVIEHGINMRDKIKEIFNEEIFAFECFDDLAGIDRAMIISFKEK